MEKIIGLLDKYYMVYLQGLWGTLWISAVTVLCSTLLGLLIAALRMSRSKLLNSFAGAYIEVLRGTPILLQLYFFWIGLPKLLPFELSDTMCIVVALVINASAYISEIIRAGINAVDKGQWEAARSVGLSEVHMMTHVIMPQAVKNILPAIANEFVVIIKESAITYTIGVQDIMSAVQQVKGATFVIIEPLLVATAIYFCLCFPTSKVIAYFERRMSRGDKR